MASDGRAASKWRRQDGEDNDLCSGVKSSNCCGGVLVLVSNMINL